MINFILGGMTVLMGFALFSSSNKDEVEIGIIEPESELVVKGPTGRYVTLSCQTCRKLKKHKEVEPNLFQCVKCKRHVDLRAS
jgi:acetyl-CoA carboxylase beta subunit